LEIGSGIIFLFIDVVRKELDRKFEEIKLSKPSTKGMSGFCQAWLRMAKLICLISRASTLEAVGHDTANMVLWVITGLQVDFNTMGYLNVCNRFSPRV
jgi:hypothetical protein